MLWRPGVRAALGYAAVVAVLLGPSIRPGHTLVPADALTQYAPYRAAAGGMAADNPLVSDAATQFYPWMRFVGASLRTGRVPQWNPLIAGGVPVNPNGYVAPWYPPYWLLRVADPFDAYNAFVALHVVVGALGIYVLSRVVGARPLAAFLAGLSAPAAGFWLHWSLHLAHLAGVVWVPWVLAAATRVVERPAPGRAAALGAVLGLWWLGANPQYAYFGAVVAALWCVVGLAARRDLRPLPWLAGAVAAGALVAAPSLWPQVAGTTPIVRGAEPAAAMTATHLPLRHAVRVLVPDATGNPADGFIYAANPEEAMDSPYVGTAAAVLAAAALAGLRRRAAPAPGRPAGDGAAGRVPAPATWHRLAPALCLAVVVVLAFTGPPHHLLRAALPGYERFRGAARWTSMLPVFALPLGALGLDAVRAGDRVARRVAVLAAGAGIAVVAAWLGRELAVPSAPHGYLARRAALAAGILAAAGLAATRPRLAAAAVAACVAVEVAAAVPRWYPDVAERTAYPAVPALAEAAARGGRLARTGPGGFPMAVPPDVPMAYGVADLSALTPLFPADWDRYLRLVADHGDTVRALNVAPALPAGALRSPLLVAADVRTVVGPSGRVVARPAGLSAAVVARAVPATREQAWRMIARPGWDPRAEAAVEGIGRPVRGGPGTVAALPASGPDRERWRVAAPAGGLVRVSGRWDRGWRATLDGRPVPVLRVDAVFRGVVVPPGTHTLAFRYRNPAERTGLWLGVAGLAALVTAAAAGVRPARPARPFWP